jgi:hypothetical protein
VLHVFVLHIRWLRGLLDGQRVPAGGGGANGGGSCAARGVMCAHTCMP